MCMCGKWGGGNMLASVWSNCASGISGKITANKCQRFICASKLPRWIVVSKSHKRIQEKRRERYRTAIVGMKEEKVCCADTIPRFLSCKRAHSGSGMFPEDTRRQRHRGSVKIQAAGSVLNTANLYDSSILELYWWSKCWIGTTTACDWLLFSGQISRFFKQIHPSI